MSLNELKQLLYDALRSHPAVQDPKWTPPMRWNDSKLQAGIPPGIEPNLGYLKLTLRRLHYIHKGPPTGQMFTGSIKMLPISAYVAIDRLPTTTVWHLTFGHEITHARAWYGPLGMCRNLATMLAFVLLIAGALLSISSFNPVFCFAMGGSAIVIGIFDAILFKQHEEAVAECGAIMLANVQLDANLDPLINGWPSHSLGYVMRYLSRVPTPVRKWAADLAWYEAQHRLKLWQSGASSVALSGT